ncbi:isopenicillin N synthase family oxygenase [Candidatus Marinimicrobia bacterium]|nr:isopenicillin N synthase family oxygenase [Candidatus Neomarinimicrobiota bacterium]MDC3333800.1 isopenicillin N synthase family oxygenase [Candidatus Neomarinimicrobiota bacterium]
MQVAKIHYNDKNAPSAFTKSLKDTGFGLIVNHPILPELIKTVYREWKDFFESELKHTFLFDPLRQDGYFPLGTENAKGYSAKDHKEFFHFYLWGRTPDSISPATKELYDSLVNITSLLLEWIELNTPPEIRSKFSEPLKDMIKDSKTNLLRIIHYPPFIGSEDSQSLRAAPHEDINLITLLVAGTEPGLEAQDKNGNWHKISTDPGTIIVNIGDMLKEVSGGYYPSTTHRVVNPESESANNSRFSMPLFLHPRDNVQLSAHYTAKTYLKERLFEIGLKT